MKIHSLQKTAGTWDGPGVRRWSAPCLVCSTLKVLVEENRKSVKQIAVFPNGSIKPRKRQKINPIPPKSYIFVPPPIRPCLSRFFAGSARHRLAKRPCGGASRRGSPGVAASDRPAVCGSEAGNSHSPPAQTGGPREDQPRALNGSSTAGYARSPTAHGRPAEQLLSGPLPSAVPATALGPSARIRQIPRETEFRRHFAAEPRPDRVLAAFPDPCAAASLDSAAQMPIMAGCPGQTLEQRSRTLRMPSDRAGRRNYAIARGGVP
jgi:hypothetical protein